MLCYRRRMQAMPIEDRKPALVQDKSAFVVSMADIEVVNDWNVRSEEDLFSDGHTGDSTGFEAPALIDGATEIPGGLVESIRLYGQQTPVDLRKNPKKAAKPFRLIAGFRRFHALQKLADSGTCIEADPTWDPKNPTIRAQIHSVDDVQARLINLRENTSRESLTPPDLAAGIAELVEMGLTDTAIAQALQLAQPTVSAYHRLYRYLQKDIFREWRTAPIAIPRTVMTDIANLPADEQRDAFERAARGQVATLQRSSAESGEQSIPGNSRSEKWLAKQLKRADEMGEMIGKLAVSGFEIDNPNFAASLTTILGDAVSTKRYEQHYGELARRLKDAYARTVNSRRARRPQDN